MEEVRIAKRIQLSHSAGQGILAVCFLPQQEPQLLDTYNLPKQYRLLPEGAGRKGYMPTRS